ncbi:MAG: hypothetical protein AB7U38_11020 [Hyphomicrobiales bacterium]
MNRLATVALAAGLAITVASGAGAADSDKIAEGLPPEISEVVSGGSWAADDTGGTYRAMVIMGHEGQTFAAHVFVQWVAFDKKTGAPKVVSTLPIKEVREQQLQNAFVFIEAEKDNEAKVSISSYDPVADKDISIIAVATAPAKYSVEK